MSRRMILLVEDDEATRDMLRLAFESAGYEVREATSGLRLVSLLSVDPIALLVMDVSTRVCDALPLCRTLREGSKLGRVPVIFTSARRGSLVAEALEAGAVDYFPKPLALGALMARARETIDVLGADE